jgi:hypothetical protein
MFSRYIRAFIFFHVSGQADTPCLRSSRPFGIKIEYFCGPPGRGRDQPDGQLLIY